MILRLKQLAVNKQILRNPVFVFTHKMYNKYFTRNRSNAGEY